MKKISIGINATKIPKDYGHFHLGLMTDKGLPELKVSQRDGKHIVIDDWGDAGFEAGKVIGEFDDAEQAIVFAYKTLLEKYPTGKPIYGAGCPPTPIVKKLFQGRRQNNEVG